jgi:hypothetical protein
MSLPYIASLLEAQSRKLVNTWVQMVRNDPRIHSDEDLTEEGLRNHIPFLIEEICQILQAGQIPHVENTREGRVHAYMRYRQGYRARDLVTEISLLRLLLLEHVAELAGSTQQDIAFKAYIEAVNTINRYLDEELRFGISVYTETEKQDTNLVDPTIHS